MNTRQANAAGITLSSGLDSTSIAAALCACPGLDVKLKAFTWVAPNFPDADEELQAAAVCEHLGLTMERIRADLFWPLSGPVGIQYVPSNRRSWATTANYGSKCCRSCGNAKSVSTSLECGGDHLFGGDVFGYPDLLLSGHWGELVRQIRAHLPYSRMKLPAILRRHGHQPDCEVICSGRWQTGGVAGTNPWLKDSVKQSAAGINQRDQRCLLARTTGTRQRFSLLQKALQYPSLSDHMRHFAAFDIECRDPLMDHRTGRIRCESSDCPDFPGGGAQDHRASRDARDTSLRLCLTCVTRFI